MDKLQRLTKAKIPGEATGIEVRKSICTLCDPNTQCGLDCYVKDGRIVKVEGTLENPHNAGTLCSKGAAQRQWVYNDERLLTPLKRVGPRGSGEFAPISWTEALDTVAQNLARLKEESGPESVVFYCGYPKHLRPFLHRLAFLYGSPNYCTESSSCFTAMNMAWRLDYGQMAAPDLMNAKLVLVWSNNAFHTGTPNARRLMDAKERGVKFIVIDPRTTPMAGIADLHLQVRPGTDGALALAMANVIISEGLYDRAFVTRWTHGFEEFRDYAATFTLQRAEETTGVPAALIREAAIMYATTKPAAIMPSAAPVVHNTNGVQNQRAISALAGLTGNYDVPGGNVATSPGWMHLWGAGFTTLEHEYEMPAKWSDFPPRLGSERFPVWSEMVDEAQAMDFPRQATTGAPYPLRGFVGFALNHRMFPGSADWLAALDTLDFVCVADLFLTDSAKHADIVLPVASSVERNEVRAYPQKFVIYSSPAIEPLGEARSDTDVIFGLAKKLGLDGYQKLEGGPSQESGEFLPNGAPAFAEAFDAAVDWMLQPSGMTTAQLKAHPGGMPVPNPTPPAFKKYEAKGFPTHTGKMELVSSVLQKYADRPGIDALPTYREPESSPVSTPDVAADYPLVLGTGSRLPMFIHSRMFRVPWTRSLRRDATVDLNPADARRYGIATGDTVELSTPKGSITVKANVSELAREGVAHMFHDYPEADVNTLLSGDYLDPISGFPGYKASLCSVKKVAPTTAGSQGVTR
jgi:anaerobic selenocysteine-containing dehydrogenase